MTDRNDHDSASLEFREQAEPLLTRFEQAWQSGERPDIVTFLGKHAGNERAWLLQQLLRIELEYRQQRSDQPTVGEYVEKFPDDKQAIERAFYAMSDSSDPPPSLTPGERATRIKCPHCGNRVQVVDEQPKEVTCATCGSTFQVEPGTTADYRPQDLPETLGRFQILERLGRGGFGTVYKAHDPKLDCDVAVKVPRAGWFDSKEEEARFLEEARSAARLKHSGIVQVHDIADEHGVPFIVSDYIEGMTLADWLSGGQPTFRETAQLLVQIADAVDHAHERGVIHRDIKPSNILLDLEGRPHLADFGLARRDEGEITVTIEGQVLGTLAYMSPEQARGEQRKVDRRSDVYSLGVVLYEMLTGELPFRGTRKMLTHQLLNDEPRAPRRLNQQVPRDLDTICVKAMAKEPNRRYRSARELADDVQRRLDGKPIRARRVSDLERTWRWCKRNPAMASLLALTILAITIGGAIATWQWRSAVAGWKSADEEFEKRVQLIQQQHAKDQASLQAEVDRLMAEAIRAEAAAIMADIDGNGDYPSTQEFAALRKLAESSEDVRVSLIEQLVNPNEEPASANAKRLERRLQFICHAVVGLDTHTRDRVKEILRIHGRTPSEHAAINIACAEIGSALGIDSLDFNEIAAANYVGAIEKTNNPDALTSLISAFLNLSETLPVEFAASSIVSVMEKSKAADDMDSMVRALVGRAEKFSGAKAPKAVEWLVIAVEEKSSGPGLLDAMGDALVRQIAIELEKESSSQLHVLVSLVKELPNVQAAKAAKIIVTAIKKAGYTQKLNSHVYFIDSLNEKLSGKQASTLGKQILASMDSKIRPNAFRGLIGAYDSLSENFSSDQAATLAASLIASMEDPARNYFPSSTHGRVIDPGVRDFFVRAFAYQAETLTGAEVAAVTEQVVSLMERTKDGRVFDFCVSAMGTLGDKLSSDQTDRFFQQVVSAIERHRGFGIVLANSSARLTSDQAATLAHHIVSALENPQTYAKYFVIVLESLAGKFTSEQATTVAQQVVNAIEKSQVSSMPYLVSVLHSLADNASDEQVAKVAKLIMTAMKNPENSKFRGMLRVSFFKLSEKLPIELTAMAANLIVVEMERTTSFSQMDSLVSSLLSMGTKLPSEQAVKATERIVVLMEDAPVYPRNAPVHVRSRRSYVHLLNSMSERLSNEQAIRVAKMIIDKLMIIDKMEIRKRHEMLHGLTEALICLRDKVPHEHIAQAAQVILSAMENPDNILRSYVHALTNLGEYFTRDQAAEVAQFIVTQMEQLCEPRYPRLELLTSLADDLLQLGVKLPSKQAEKAAYLMVVALQKKGSRQHDSFFRMLGGLCDRLSGEQIATLAEQIVLVIKSTTAPLAPPWTMDTLVTAFETVAEKLPSEKVAGIAQQIVTVWDSVPEKAVHGQSTKASLGRALGSLGKDLPPRQAAQMAERIVDAIEKARNSREKDSLVEALFRLGADLPTNRVALVAQHIVDRLERGGIGLDLDDLYSKLDSLGEKVRGEQATTLVLRILARMLENMHVARRNGLDALGGALVSLADKVEPAQAENVLKHVGTTMQKTTQPSILPILHQVFVCLAENVSNEQAANLANLVMTEMKKSNTSTSAVSSLGEVLACLAERISDGEVETIAKVLMEAIKKAINPSKLDSLGRALRIIGGKLHSESAATLSQQILVAMESTTSIQRRDALRDALRGAAASLDTVATISVLKSVAVIGPTRQKALQVLSQKNFDGKPINIWQVVEWAEQYEAGIVTKAPRFPIHNQIPSAPTNDSAM